MPVCWLGPARQVVALPTRRVEGVHLLTDAVARTLAVTHMADGHQGLGQVHHEWSIDLFGTPGGIGVARLKDVERAVIGIVVEIADEDKIPVVEVAFEDLSMARAALLGEHQWRPVPHTRFVMVYHDHKVADSSGSCTVTARRSRRIRKEGLALVRDEEMRSIAIQIGR